MITNTSMTVEQQPNRDAQPTLRAEATAIPVSGAAMSRLNDGPLSLLNLCRRPHTGEASSPTSDPATRPLALRDAQPAPVGEVPDHRYDPQRQIAADPDGRPLAPMLKKEWTSYESTHTDGDGGDNETWGWEEQ